MTLTDRQARERASLEDLLKVLDSREPNIDNLSQAVRGALTWGHPDATPHLREALRHYLSKI